MAGEEAETGHRKEGCGNQDLARKRKSQGWVGIIRHAKKVTWEGLFPMGLCVARASCEGPSGSKGRVREFLLGARAYCTPYYSP